MIVSNSKLGMSFKSKLSEKIIFFSEGESHVLKGDISKTGVHKQCGISVTTPQLLTKCVTEIQVSLKITLIFICIRDSN